jgi:DNA-binding CsgD family transcriptional regulator
LLVAGEAEVWLGGAAGGSWPGALTVGIASVLLLARRQAPIRCAAAIFACQALCARWAEPDAVTFMAISILAWYCVGRWANPRQALLALGAIGLITVATVTPGTPKDDWINQYLSVCLTAFVVPWLVGFLVRSRADTVDRGESRAALAGESSTGSERRKEPWSSDVSRLSPRELEVFTLLADGATNSEIAEQLVVSIYTVKAHVASILTKLQLRDRVQVVLYAHNPEALTRPSSRA